MDVAFMDFNQGNLEGYARYPKENDAIEFMKKVPDNEIVVEKYTLKLRLLEGTEEEEYLKKTSDTVLELRKKQKMNSRNNKKRKGNFGGYGKNKKTKNSD